MIDPRAIIDPSAVIGENVEIGPWTTIGAAVAIGDGCRIASHVVIEGPTRIGRHNQIFQFSSIGGNVTIGDYAEVDGHAVIAENRTVGAGSHVAAMSLVIDDVPAYVAVTGNPASAVGLNVDGMRRCGTAAEVIAALCDAFEAVYLDGQPDAKALDALRGRAQRYREVQSFLNSVESAAEK